MKLTVVYLTKTLLFDFRTNHYKVQSVERNFSRLECIIKNKRI